MKFKAESYILFVQDMTKLAAFYEGAFGFKRVKNAHYEESQWLELQAGKAFKLCLHKFPKPGSPKGNRNKIVFSVDDVGKARAYLVKKKVKMGKHHHWPGGDACDGRDPEGNAFQLQGPATPG